jgi:hypothetical protein
MRPGRDALNVSTRPNLKPWIAAMAKDGRKFNTARSTAKARAARAAVRQALSVSYEVGRAEWLSGRVPMMPMMPAPQIKPVTEAKLTPATTETEGREARRLKPILCKLWPPHGQPPKLAQKQIVANVNDVYEPLYGCSAKRTTVFRIIKALTPASR